MNSEQASPMQRRVILLRHGHADEGSDDYSRPLNERGRNAAQRAGEALSLAAWLPAVVLSSPAPRARDTAELAAAACGYNGSITLERSLYLATDRQYLTALQDLDASTASVLLVGHNPGLTALARALCGHGGDLAPAELVSKTFEIESWAELDFDAA
jgi:phosphohistidine phosphatase